LDTTGENHRQLLQLLLLRLFVFFLSVFSMFHPVFASGVLEVISPHKFFCTVLALSFIFFMMRRDEYCLLPGEFFLSGDVAEITQLLLHHW
jgi:hypothetical protein